MLNIKKCILGLKCVEFLFGGDNRKTNILIIRGIQAKNTKGRNGCVKNGNAGIEKGLERMKVDAEKKDEERDGSRQNTRHVAEEKEQMVDFIPSSWRSA